MAADSRDGVVPSFSFDPFAGLSGFPGSGPSHDLRHVVCLLGVVDLQRRMILRMALGERGIGNVFEAIRLEDLHHQIIARQPDLIICDEVMGDTEVASLIHGVRQGSVGASPFLVVATLSGLPVADKVRGLVNAGVDDLISLPVAPRAVVARTLSLIDRRRPFVVTSDYIGPDRRHASRRADTPPRLLIEPPNTLRLKALGQYNAEVVARQIDALRGELNLRKIERHAERIVAIAGAILPRLHLGTQDERVRTLIRQVGTLAHEIAGRIEGTPFAGHVDLCIALHDVTGRLDDASPGVTDVELAEQLVAAVERAFVAQE